MQPRRSRLGRDRRCAHRGRRHGNPPRCDGCRRRGPRARIHRRPDQRGGSGRLRARRSRWMAARCRLRRATARRRAVPRWSRHRWRRTTSRWPSRAPSLPTPRAEPATSSARACWVCTWRGRSSVARRARTSSSTSARSTARGSPACSSARPGSCASSPSRPKPTPSSPGPGCCRPPASSSRSATAPRPTPKRAAADAGATLVTHLFNGMRPFNHREPGLAGAALDDPRLTPSLIADLVHVHPAALRLAIGAKRSVALVTDAVAVDAGTIGDVVMQERDGAARLADGTLAGSMLTMDRAVRNVVDLGLSARPGRRDGIDGARSDPRVCRPGPARARAARRHRRPRSRLPRRAGGVGRRRTARPVVANRSPCRSEPRS